MKFKRLTDGHYVGIGSTALELVRSIDDSDGYERREWTIWTANRGRCIGICPTLPEAKTKARALHHAGVA